MEEREYRYAAFISYRHIEPDMTAAKRLHTLIENYTVPRAVSGADGKRKLGRVFRDQEELMLSGDLGGDIRKALEDSEWLIVICTPALLKSDWCMKEIDTFLELGRRDRILTVLADGTPQESIPRRLRFIETEGQTVEKEPLAANIVADSRSGMLKKLKSESLRIFAPMLGVTYDDLKRRERAQAEESSFCIAGVTRAAGRVIGLCCHAEPHYHRAEKRCADKSVALSGRRFLQCS